MSVVEELSGDGSRIVTSWKRTTVADGDWLQHNTIGPLNERDVFLAEKIDELSGNAEDRLDEEIEARKNADTFLSGTIDTFSGNYETFKSKTEGNIDYLSGSIDGLKEDLDTEIEDRSREDGLLQAQIDTIKAATDVIMVYGDYHTFTANSGDLILTDADVIKVLVDESTNDKQVYYQWYDPKLEHEWSGWSGIGSLDPYYSVSEIDEYKEEVDDKFDSLSATVANNYLSANNTAVSAGKNIIVTNETGTKVGIKTKDDVSFSSVSAKGFSGTNLSGLNQNDTIDNLFGSAYSGAEASAWINDNSTRLDIQAGYGLETGEDDDGHLVIGLHQERCDYNKYGLALGSWCTAHTINIGNASFAFGESCVVTGGQGTIAAGSNVDITGRFSVGLGDASNINGNYSYSIGEQNNLTDDRQYAFGQGLSGNSFMIGRYNEVEPNAQFVIGGGTTGAYSVTSHKNLLVIKNDVISARDFSAGNVSLSSLTNLSALGNGITNTARFNLSAVKLSAGSGINFNSAAQNTLGISVKYTTTNGYVTELDGIPLSAGANYTPGRCITIDDQNKINLSSDINLNEKLVIDHYNSSDRDTYTSAILECFQLKFNGASDNGQTTYHNSAIYDIFGVQLYDANASKHILMNNENGLCISSYQGNLSSYSRVDATFIELDHKANVAHASPYYLKIDGNKISAGSNTSNVTAAQWSDIINKANGTWVSATSQEIVIDALYQTKFVVTSTIPDSLNANTYYII